VSRIEARTVRRPKLKLNEVKAALPAAIAIMRVWQASRPPLLTIRPQANTAEVAKPYRQACCIIRCCACTEWRASMVHRRPMRSAASRFQRRSDSPQSESGESASGTKR
jgi:hypothetical protein